MRRFRQGSTVCRVRPVVFSRSCRCTGTVLRSRNILFFKFFLAWVLVVTSAGVLYSQDGGFGSGVFPGMDEGVFPTRYVVVFQGQLFALSGPAGVDVLYDGPVRTGADKYSFETVTDEQVRKTGMFMISSLTEGDTFDINGFYRDMEVFGKTSGLDEKLLLLQLFGTLGRDIFDSEKLWQSDLTFFPNGDEITDDAELLAAMRAYVQGEDVRAGVCTDTGLMLNKIAGMWGLDGGFVIGTNRTGLIHPSVIYYDTSHPERTVAVVQDWDKVAAFEFNTPEDLADAVAEIAGTHGMGKILFDGNGDVVRMIHSQSEQALLKNLGQRELWVHLDRISSGDLLPRRSYQRSSHTQTTVDFGEYFLEHHYFQTLIAPNNVMLVGGRRWAGTERWRSSLRVAVEREFAGTTAPFFDDHTNRHVKALARYDVEFNAPAVRSSTMPLGLETSLGMDSIIGYQMPEGSTAMQPFITMPLLKPRAVSVLKIFDEHTGPSVDVSMAVDGYFLLPRNVAETIAVISPYLNVVLDEFIGNVRTWIPLGETSRVYVDTGSIITPTDVAARGGVGVRSVSGLGGELSVRRGFPRGRLPVFYRQPRYDVAASLFVPFSNVTRPTVTVELGHLGTVEERYGRVVYDSRFGVRLGIAY